MKVDGGDLCQWRKWEDWNDIVGETIDVAGGVAKEILGVAIMVVAAVTDDLWSSSIVVSYFGFHSGGPGSKPTQTL